MFERITANDSPDALAQADAEAQARLKESLRLATARASRSSARIKQLFASAKVSGMVAGDSIKAAAVTFSAEPFKGGLHLVYPWKVVAELTRTELASSISSSLRMNLRKHEKS